MHEAALSRAALPAPTVCLGMLLRPYSLGHELWLLREESPIAASTLSPATSSILAALPAAVLICCQTWDQLSRMRHDRILGLKLWIWNRRMRKLDFARELKTFCDYRAEGLLEFPPSEIERPDRTPGRLPGAPFILSLQQWLQVTFRLSEAAAWDYPVGLAKMRWAAHWEREGGFDIYNRHEAEHDIAVAQMDAEDARKVGSLPDGKDKCRV